MRVDQNYCLEPPLFNLCFNGISPGRLAGKGLDNVANRNIGYSNYGENTEDRYYTKGSKSMVIITLKSSRGRTAID